MKRRQVVLLLICAAMAFPSTVHAEKLNFALMSCSKGDRLNISLNNRNTDWEISDASIAEIHDGIVYVKDEGKCELVNKTGYTIKLTSSGSTSNSSIIDVNYSTSTNDLRDVEVMDKTIDVKTVEVNGGVDSDVVSSNSEDVPVMKNSAYEEKLKELEENTYGVNASEDISSNSTKEVSEFVSLENDSSDLILPDTNEDFSYSDEEEDEEVSANKEGVYASESDTGEVTVVRVVAPELNETNFNGSLGETINLSITNSDCDVFFTSDNEEVAVVDLNGCVTLTGEGVTTIYADTEYNRLECSVRCTLPYVNTDDVHVMEDETYQIKIKGNTANLPVSYEILEGDGEVSEDGEVSVKDGKEVLVKITIGDDLSFEKRVICSNNHESYWEAMQPAIKECLGTPYVFGGVTPKKGMDCSAYVSYVYRSVGLVGGRYTAQGLYNMAEKTTNPKPGDMVFFQGTYSTSDYITHIGIYAGNGEMYHSGDPNQKVSLNSAYWRQHLVGYGTMIDEESEYIGNGSPSTKYITSVKNKSVSDLSKDTGYSQDELELIWAIVGQECSANYEGALAVISSAYNRASQNWGGYGTDVLSQLKAPSQYCYSPSVSPSYLWQNRLNGNVADYVKQAVDDCLIRGKTNHNYCSFRSYPTGPNCTNIGGNWYF